jgi:hypothetical protein
VVVGGVGDTASNADAGWQAGGRGRSVVRRGVVMRLGSWVRRVRGLPVLLLAGVSVVGVGVRVGSGFGVNDGEL